MIGPNDEPIEEPTDAELADIEGSINDIFDLDEDLF